MADRNIVPLHQRLYARRFASRLTAPETAGLAGPPLAGIALCALLFTWMGFPLAVTVVACFPFVLFCLVVLARCGFVSQRSREKAIVSFTTLTGVSPETRRRILVALALRCSAPWRVRSRRKAARTEIYQRSRASGWELWLALSSAPYTWQRPPFSKLHAASVRYDNDPLVQRLWLVHPLRTVDPAAAAMYAVDSADRLEAAGATEIAAVLLSDAGDDARLDSVELVEAALHLAEQ